MSILSGCAQHVQSVHETEHSLQVLVLFGFPCMFIYVLTVASGRAESPSLAASGNISAVSAQCLHR